VIDLASSAIDALAKLLLCLIGLAGLRRGPAVDCALGFLGLVFPPGLAFGRHNQRPRIAHVLVAIRANSGFGGHRENLEAGALRRGHYLCYESRPRGCPKLLGRRR